MDEPSQYDAPAAEEIQPNGDPSETCALTSTLAD
jgi:hypothetical protein